MWPYLQDQPHKCRLHLIMYVGLVYINGIFSQTHWSDKNCDGKVKGSVLPDTWFNYIDIWENLLWK